MQHNILYDGRAPPCRINFIIWLSSSRALVLFARLFGWRQHSPFDKTRAQEREGEQENWSVGRPCRQFGDMRPATPLM